VALGTEIASFEQVADIPVSTAEALVYEFGWQSWTPSTAYRLHQPSFRPATPARAVSGYRAERPKPAGVYQGDGLLAVQPAEGAPVTVFSAIDGRVEVPTIRATLEGSSISVSADAAVHVAVYDCDLSGALAASADDYIARTSAPALRPMPPVWATWYHYFTELTHQDVVENLDAMDSLELDVGVVRLDDAFQAGIGDWLSTSEGFTSLGSLVKEVTDRGRIAGLWIAPLLVGSSSALYSEHPEWLVRNPDGSPVLALSNWGQECYALDATHPGAQEYLAQVFTQWHAYGARYFMIDFMFAGAMPGIRYDSEISPIEAYRRVLELIRGIIGDSYLQACGAPMFPSVGLVDSMRVGPDVALGWAASGGDLSRPGLRSAAVSTAGRAFTHGRFWLNDPDCFMVRPGIERREEWADIVERYSGVRLSSDRLVELDAWGLERTRELLVAADVTPLDLTGSDNPFSHFA
jgi:alpha-galactosidase